MNTNKNRFLNFDEFKAGFSEAGLDEESLLTCFKEINKHGGHMGINLQEFLIALQVCLLFYYPPEVISMKYCSLGVFRKEYFMLITK